MRLSDLSSDVSSRCCDSSPAGSLLIGKPSASGRQDALAVRARHLEQQTEQAWCPTLATNAGRAITGRA